MRCLSRLSFRGRCRLLLLGLALAGSACAQREKASAASSDGGYETLELRYQGNNGTIAPVELAEDLGYLAPIRFIYRDRAIEKGGLRSVVSDYEMFGKFTAGSYVMKTSFIREHPNTARKFVEAVAQAIEWSRTTPREQVIARFHQIMAKRRRNESADALKYWRSYGVAGQHGIMSDRDFQVWIDWISRMASSSPGSCQPETSTPTRSTLWRLKG